MKKLLIKLLGDAIYTPDTINKDHLQKWLLTSFGDDGFKNYYTMRKKYLVSLLSLGIEGREMYEAVGRLKELNALRDNIKSEHKRYETQQKKLAYKKSMW